MNRNNQKEPLFRKVNTKARNVHHNFGGDFKYSRNKKQETLEQAKGTMYGKKERGLDYTPLFKFLLSKVGSEWNEIFSEAKSRLDKTEPIFWLVALNQNEKEDFVRISESTYFSGMYIDDEGILQLTNLTLKPADLKHYCDCCTHTFNGTVY
ncbi:hypothetical protein EZ428_21920 [Pedobacter frigiditerrae]|uniref:Uncharacterized protein n=1 Tax=Pedobacter frigiditerrae TaxID=2530452 RepID=A0A4R0MLQ2_9SPHI|nr:hypothetical protein [Pedobacter frigiditerrae]TCC87357.1 hypothetical protein EZ428_21920 [Pedobacter frigiditerrae]